MKKYIFDLDFTLYNGRDSINESAGEEEYYNSFKFKPFLKELLVKFYGEVYIFTNANTFHATEVLTKMGLREFFPDNRIVSRDNTKISRAFLDNSNRVLYADVYFLKPKINGYNTVIKKFNIVATDEVYFFEDTFENLKTAEKFGWKTVLIYNDSTKILRNSVDYAFSHIEDALLFFLLKKQLAKKL